MHSPLPGLLFPGLWPQILNQQKLSSALWIPSPVSSLPPFFILLSLFFLFHVLPFLSVSLSALTRAI